MAEEKKGKKKRPTALKRDIQNEKKYAKNHAFKSAMRTRIRKLKEAIGENQVETTQKELSAVYSYLDKAVKRGVIKANKAKRDKSRLAARAKAAA